jgi:hypothetical protein
MVISGCPRLHVAERAATPAAEPFPVRIDVVSGSVVEAGVKQHLAPSARFRAFARVLLLTYAARPLWLLFDLFHGQSNMRHRRDCKDRAGADVAGLDEIDCTAPPTGEPPTGAVVDVVAYLTVKTSIERWFRLARVC